MKILIAEDDRLSRILLSSTLKQLGHEVVAVENGGEAWAAFENEDFALIISDWVMPDINGLELCRRVREAQRSNYTYVILLSALGGKANYIDAMDAGTDDFITKPFDTEQLRSRLRVAERILHLHEQLRSQAIHDSLTGLFNRAAILEFLQQELDRAAREEKSVGVVMVDLDYFKAVNDTYGHSAGDKVLVEAAARMHRSLRSYDKVGRYGGEEFLIIIPGCDAPGAVVLAERVRCCIGAESIQIPEGSLTVTGSMGIAISCAGNPRSANVLVAAADLALYKAKANGRNCVQIEQFAFSGS